MTTVIEQYYAKVKWLFAFLSQIPVGEFLAGWVNLQGYLTRFAGTMDKMTMNMDFLAKLPL
ncbi:MAG: hypothetical protein ACREFR_11865 [Limisphaerales bacterium]